MHGHRTWWLNGLPDGSCVFFGGYFFAGETCTDLVDAAWPGEWVSTEPGTYTASVDVSAYNLGGEGAWSLTLINGWNSTFAGVSSYNATLTLNGLCTSEDIVVLGCTDPEACNFNANASEDDGSCLTLDECGILVTTALAEVFQPEATRPRSHCGQLVHFGRRGLEHCCWRGTWDSEIGWSLEANGVVYAEGVAGSYRHVCRKDATNST